MTVRLWLVRHGETQSNIDGVFQGQLDTDLTERGIRQASAVGEALRVIEFEAAFSSDLRRAADTANQVLAGRSTSLTLDPRLRELHYGVLQGISYNDFPRVLASHGIERDWGPGLFSETGMAAPEGESLQEMNARLTEFLSDLDRMIETDEVENVLLVSHGGTLRTLMTILLELPLEARNAFTFANCSVSRVLRSDGSSRLELHNAVYWEGCE
ncbi:MAG: histidine phosphatase family protein [Chloroflexota bacterium]